MSYLRLDRTNINYLSPTSIRGGIILSQVVDSPMSPENPVLISSSNELDIYFGRSFKEREYFEELLSANSTLLLTNPSKEYELPILDITDFKVITEVKDKLSEEEIELRYYDQLPEIGEENTKYYVSSKKEYYIYYDKDWIKVSDIPKVLNEKPLSNRDTLRLTYKGWKGIILENGDGHVWEKSGNKLLWCWPRYDGDYPDLDYNIKSIQSSLKSSDIFEESLGFILDFSKLSGPLHRIGNEETDWTYLVVPLPGDKKLQVYVGEEGDSLPPELFHTESDDSNRQRIPEDISLQEQIDLIIPFLEKNGWKCIKEDEDGKIWKLYTSDFLPDLKFYNIPGLEFYGDKSLTHDLLSLISEPAKRMEFFSKTLGNDGEDIKIEITQIKGETERYRVVLSRYDYQEVFEGPLYLEYDEDTLIYTSLEKTINQSSSLVSCKVYSSKGDGSLFSKNNPDDGLPTGEFTLSRATPQTSWTPDDYWRGIEKLQEFNVSEDFLMIPRIEDYLKVGVKPKESWYSEYKDLLDYAVSKNCQVLITNHPYYFGCDTFDDLESNNLRPEDPQPKNLYIIEGRSAEIWEDGKWKVLGTAEGEGRWEEIIKTLSPEYTGNQIFNYLIKNEEGDVIKDLDPDNRLIYFYQNMTYRGWNRPGWYIFLRGILLGDYSQTTDEIVYSSPSKYYTEEENMGSALEKCKSNFLSDNGHLFYYRRFFSHPGTWKYDHTILERFCINKVSNTVSRDFPAYLSKETTGEIIRGLQNILTGLSSRYSLIHTLNLDHIEEDPYNQTLSVYLNLGIRETLDKDVKLSVTLNFNFT